MKRCNQCKELKSLESFHLDKYARDGKYTICKQCKREYQQKNIERDRSWKKDYYKTNLTYFQEYRLQRKYGISFSTKIQMKMDQGYKCAICGEVVELVVDHNHKTGAVRNLLCHACNRMIGIAQESPSILRQAALYLEKW